MDEDEVDVSHNPLATSTTGQVVSNLASHVTADLDPRPSVGSEDLLRSQFGGRFSPTESQSDTLLTGVVCTSSAVAAPSSASCYEETHAEWRTEHLAAAVEGNNMNTNNRTVPVNSTGQIGINQAPMPYNQSTGQHPSPNVSGGPISSVQTMPSSLTVPSTPGTSDAATTGSVSPPPAQSPGLAQCICGPLCKKSSPDSRIETWYGKPVEGVESPVVVMLDSATSGPLEASNEGLSQSNPPVTSPQTANQLPNFRTYFRSQSEPTNDISQLRSIMVEKAAPDHFTEKEPAVPVRTALSKSVHVGHVTSKDGGHVTNKCGTAWQSGLEVIESQMRKLRAENATLMTENKQLKDNYNKAQSKLVKLEAELSCRTSPRHLATSSETTHGCSQQIQQRQNEREVERLRNEVEMLRSQNAVSAKGSNLDESYREEIKVLKVELESTRELLQRMEHDLHSQMHQQGKAATELAHLKDVNRKLNAQMEGSISSIDSQKEINLLQTKLRVAVERLQEERTQRSEKLSQIEEQLINENATLKVAEKELMRQLERARERHASVVEKHRELYEELENLKVALTFTPDLRTPAKLADQREVHFQEQN